MKFSLTDIECPTYACKEIPRRRNSENTSSRAEQSTCIDQPFKPRVRVDSGMMVVNAESDGDGDIDLSVQAATLRLCLTIAAHNNTRVGAAAQENTCTVKRDKDKNYITRHFLSNSIRSC